MSAKTPKITEREFNDTGTAGIYFMALLAVFAIISFSSIRWIQSTAVAASNNDAATNMTQALGALQDAYAAAGGSFVNAQTTAQQDTGASGGSLFKWVDGSQPSTNQAVVSVAPTTDGSAVIATVASPATGTCYIGLAIGAPQSSPILGVTNPGTYYFKAQSADVGGCAASSVASSAVQSINV